MTRIAEDGQNVWFRVEWASRRNGDYDESFFASREEALEFAQQQTKEFRSVLVSEKGEYETSGKVRRGFVYFWWSETDCKEWGDLPEAGHGYPLGVRGVALSTLKAYVPTKPMRKDASIAVGGKQIAVSAIVSDRGEEWHGNLAELVDWADIWIEAESLAQLKDRMVRAWRIWQEGERQLALTNQR